MRYLIKAIPKRPVCDGNWNHPAWQAADVLNIEHFHPKSSDHRPLIQAKAIYDRDGLAVFFDVSDSYVRCVHIEHQASVCLDSCVEFFVSPKPDSGYMNFEINCGGTMLVHHNRYEQQDGRPIRRMIPVDEEWLKQIEVYHSMPKVVEPEITEPTRWQLQFAIPFDLLAAYCGPLGDVAGQTWHANFYKCADKTSHPHWASWAPIGEALDFHQPRYFAPIQFEA